jgi:hypothetical protein
MSLEADVRYGLKNFKQTDLRMICFERKLHELSIRCNSFVAYSEFAFKIAPHKTQIEEFV